MTKMCSHVDKTTTIQTYSAATLIVSRNKCLYISFIFFIYSIPQEWEDGEEKEFVN